MQLSSGFSLLHSNVYTVNQAGLMRGVDVARDMCEEWIIIQGLV